MSFMTKQQQVVLCAIMFLLLVGWAVKSYRIAHPPAAVLAPAKT